MLQRKGREQGLIMTDAQCRQRGEEKVVCFCCTTHLTTSYIVRPPSPLWQALQPRSLLLPVRVDACGLASGSCISLLFTLNHFILNSLYIFSLIDLLAEAAQQPHSQRPPIKRVVRPTLLFGRHPFLYSCFLSCSVYSLWSGKAACFGPGGLIKSSCRVYNPMLTFW